MTNKPELKGNQSPDISHLEIFEEGVKKLFKMLHYMFEHYMFHELTGYGCQ
jgi:hypothetical protein